MLSSVGVGKLSESPRRRAKLSMRDYSHTQRMCIASPDRRDKRSKAVLFGAALALVTGLASAQTPSVIRLGVQRPAAAGNRQEAPPAASASGTALPSMPQTSVPPANPMQTSLPQASASASPAGSTRGRRPPSVIVDGSRVEIRADNSSLNNILRMLAQQTGLKITGGVLDQRVFGNYGPGPAADVLTQLLQDTGTNMILRQTPGGELTELVLTPRLGGPTPPSPSSFRDDSEPATPASSVATPSPAATNAVSQPVSTQPGQQQHGPALPMSNQASQPGPASSTRAPVTPDPQGIADPPMAAPAPEAGTTPGAASQSTGQGGTNSGGTAPKPSSDAKTPQQIYEELQKLQQQQQQH